MSVKYCMIVIHGQMNIYIYISNVTTFMTKKVQQEKDRYVWDSSHKNIQTGNTYSHLMPVEHCIKVIQMSKPARRAFPNHGGMHLAIVKVTKGQGQGQISGDLASHGKGLWKFEFDILFLYLMWFVWDNRRWNTLILWLRWICSIKIMLIINSSATSLFHWLDTLWPVFSPSHWLLFTQNKMQLCNTINCQFGACSFDLLNLFEVA